MWRPLALALFLTLVLPPGTGLGQSVDPHAVFEARCSRCHTDHAADFARKSLVIMPDGTLVGAKKGKPVTRFLRAHPGRPSTAEIAALVDMFARQIRSGGLFREKCTSCHKRAVSLARRTLVVRGRSLVGRYTGNVMDEFMANHGRLEGDEVETIVRMLRWQVEKTAR